MKQGDVCSPVLFSLFINELALDIINNSRHGVSLSCAFVHAVSDIICKWHDIAVWNCHVDQQTQLNSLFSAASRSQLKVNMNESNIVVFRKGGNLGVRERWFYDDCRMRHWEWWTLINILEYCFSASLSFYHACQDLVSREKRAMLYINSKLYRIDCRSVNVVFCVKIFDAQMQPIVLYRAKIWGLESSS